MDTNRLQETDEPAARMEETGQAMSTPEDIITHKPPDVLGEQPTISPVVEETGTLAHVPPQPVPNTHQQPLLARAEFRPALWIAWLLVGTVLLRSWFYWFPVLGYEPLTNRIPITRIELDTLLLFLTIGLHLLLAWSLCLGATNVSTQASWLQRKMPATILLLLLVSAFVFVILRFIAPARGWVAVDDDWNDRWLPLWHGLIALLSGLLLWVTAQKSQITEAGVVENTPRRGWLQQANRTIGVALIAPIVTATLLMPNPPTYVLQATTDLFTPKGKINGLNQWYKSPIHALSFTEDEAWLLVAKTYVLYAVNLSNRHAFLLSDDKFRNEQMQIDKIKEQLLISPDGKSLVILYTPYDNPYVEETTQENSIVAIFPFGAWRAYQEQGFLLPDADRSKPNFQANFEMEVFATYLGITSLAFRADSQQLAIGLADGRLMLWDFMGRKLERTLHTGLTAIRTVAFSPNQQWLAVGLQDGTVQIWSPQNGEQPIQTLHDSNGSDSNSSTESLLFSSDSRWLMVAHTLPADPQQRSGSAGIWHSTYTTDGWSLVDDLTINIQALQSATHFPGYTADGRWLLSQSPEGKSIFLTSVSKSLMPFQDQVLHRCLGAFRLHPFLWRYISNDYQDFYPHSKAVVALSPHGTWLARGEKDGGYLGIWRLK